MVFAINEHELATGIHVSPHPEPLSPPYPSRLSQSTGFVCPAYASNLHWSSNLYMVIYTFQCYSLKSL